MNTKIYVHISQKQYVETFKHCNKDDFELIFIFLFYQLTMIAGKQ